MIWKKIYTGDYSKEGFDKGFSDGDNGKPKNKLSFVSTINPINYAWNYNNSFQSYMGNYDSGYLDGSRNRNGVYSGINQTTGGNMGKDSYERQLKVLQEAKEKMNLLKSKIVKLNENYSKQLSFAESNSFMGNYIDQLKQMKQIFLNDIDEFSNAINREVMILEKHENEIAKLMRNAQ